MSCKSQSLTPFKKFNTLYIQNNSNYLQIIEHGLYLELVLDPMDRVGQNEAPLSHPRHSMLERDTGNEALSH